MSLAADFTARLRESPTLREMYSEIRQFGPIKKSKAGLSIPVSKPTRYSLIHKLVELGAVEVVPDKNGVKGPVVDIRPDLGYSIGVDIHFSGIDFMVADLKMNEVTQFHLRNHMDLRAMRVRDNKDQVIHRIRGGLHRLMQTAGIDASQVMAMGISDYGSVNASEGISLLSPHIEGWQDIPIREILSRVLSVPVYLWRDANLMAIAERHATGMNHVNNMICISIRSGIGLGIIANGSVYGGFTGNAGEWSHVVIDPNGHQCACGRRGCVDTVLGYGGLLRTVRSQVPGFEEIIDRKDVMERGPLAVPEILKRYESGDAQTVRALDRYIRRLAEQLANLLCQFDPQICMLTGLYTASGDRFVGRLTAELEKNFPKKLPFVHTVVRGKLGLKAACWGATFMAQQVVLGVAHR